MKKLFAIVGFSNYIFVVFLNAFTDLGHKIIIQNTVFKVYDAQMQIMLTAIVNALILLPFILMFSPSGFLSDRFSKSKIMEYSSIFAVVITLCITFFYYQGYFIAAFIMTFLLALQSALYSPAKYGYIKELVGESGLSAANGVVQAVTTIAILSGIIVYTLLFELTLDDNFTTKEDLLMVIAPLGWLLVLGSVLEWFLASKLPNTMLQASQKTFTFRRYIRGAYLRKNLKTLTRKAEIFDAIIALSLFWSISQVILAIFGEYAKGELGVTNTIYVQGVMALAGIGIVAGALLAARFSLYYINSGIATLGAFGITLIVFIIPFSTSMPFLALLFLLFGVFAGMIMVPLNALIQLLSPRVHLGVVLAGNNFVQNIFMFTFLIVTTFFASLGMNAEVLFYLMGLVGVFLTYLLFTRYDIMTYWAFFEFLFKFGHRFRYHGLENIPQDRAVLLVGNHVSWIDWFILQLPIQKRVNYMMDKNIYHKKIFHKTLKKGEVIPLSPKAAKDALSEASLRLGQQRVVALFPEGAITRDGKLGVFHKGYGQLAKNEEVVVIPFFIDGMFGSLFAPYKGEATKPFYKKRDVEVYFGEKLANDIEADDLHEVIANLQQKYQK
jgi:acyl-[acyl-carrier-protein]-phospholipid O-acyltransferase / long-chain-fatty-acid--[acyl-carrier-protein] ligase